jgi:TATA element modulatory factor
LIGPSFNTMADWKAGAFDDDGDGWEDVAAVPTATVVTAPLQPRLRKPVVVVDAGLVGSGEGEEGVGDGGVEGDCRETSGTGQPTLKAGIATQAAGFGEATRPGLAGGLDGVAHRSGAAGDVGRDVGGGGDGGGGGGSVNNSLDTGSSASPDGAVNHCDSEERTGEVTGRRGNREDDAAFVKLTAALAASEKKVAALTRERDGLRKAREARVNRGELAKDKDKQIAAIMAEGELLSVKIAEKESSLRNLRTTVKNQSAQIEELKLAISAAEAKFHGNAAKQRALETSEKAALEGKEAAERRLRQVESDVRTKSSSSAALEAARSQLESLRKTHATALENQAMRLRAEADAELEKVNTASKEEQYALNKAIAELRGHLTQVSENAGWKEDQLRKEMNELRARADALEARNEELAEAVPGATRPLLRQVEALQAAAHERTRAISAVERSQLERLRQAEVAVATGAERERAAEERIGALLARVAALEEQVRIAQTDATRSACELREARSVAAQADLAHQRALDSAQVVGMKILREKEAAVDELSKARVAHLDDMEAAEERERKLSEKVSLLESKTEALQARFVNAQAMISNPGYGTPRGFCDEDSIHRSDSSSSMVQASHYRRASGEHLVSPLHADDAPGSAKWSVRTGSVFDHDMTPGDFLAESVSAPGGVYDTERLNASLRQRTGEIASLQAQLASKDVASQALADEVVSLAARVEELTNELSDAPLLRKEFEEFKVRHRALLELHGEREERVLELEADLVDINQMYKEQITDLLLKLEQQI